MRGIPAWTSTLQAAPVTGPTGVPMGEGPASDGSTNSSPDNRVGRR